VIGRVTGRDLDEIHIVGGGANNELLCRWTAEAAGRSVLAGPAEATLFGNVLVQAMALGEISSLEEGRDIVRRSMTPVVYDPTANTGWREARERFAALAGALPVVEAGT
jgi:rhamnulokinase